MINKFRYKKPIVDRDDVTVKNGKDTRRKAQQHKAIEDDEKEKDSVTSLFTELFSQLQFSTESALPPDALRRALAESFFDQNRFQLGFMDDAAECFENILLRIHAHIAEGASEDMCDVRHCVPHRKFAMTLVEQTICTDCGATSEPLSYTQMVHYVSTSTLVYQVRANINNPPLSFGKLLMKAGNMGDMRTCASSCGAEIQIRQTLINRPEIVSIGLVWNSERPSLEHITEVFSSIGTTIQLGDVFSNSVDGRWADTSIHNLVGVVTYYGKHYSTFFFHTKLRVWIYFDDATVREVGPRWDQVVEKCRKGRYQPLLLLYALPEGTPVNTENAPKHITTLCNDKLSKKPPPSVLRRSVTPSPEKPTVGTTRRAITPNPDGSPVKHNTQKLINEYQNLSVIQKSLTPECDFAVRKSLELSKSHVTVQRTPSNGSSSGMEGISIPNNVPRNRDSGNWSGDRNSASSASSTTMENPYLYLVGKVPHGIGSVPGSPTRTKSDLLNGNGHYDTGYDSYSLSSNDSSTVTTLQHLIKMGHLAKIPEDYNTTANPVSQSCDVLCNEADGLLVKSRQLEDEHDLVLALALCNAAATKARAAMNAPYNNPQTLILARMKHNTCIMRARSLHRRMTQTQAANKESPPEIRHTRDGSSASGRHSRQNSRDKTGHSRQNSRELLVTDKETKPVISKSIEIYATLPKKKDLLKNKFSLNFNDNESEKFQNKPAARESRSIFSKQKNKENKVREKRSRSEDRNKISTDFFITPEIMTVNDAPKKAKEGKEEKKDSDGKSKKQHKIRRKLLMGGLIKRKNRSMPDLTEAAAVTEPANRPTTTVDDSNVGLTGSLENGKNMCGYLSEGHLEYVGNNANPNLERSKLMRKSFHSSAGKILTAAKVPPPPPLRTTSQLSKSKFAVGEICEDHKPTNHIYNNLPQFGYGAQMQDYHCLNQAPSSLPYFNSSGDSRYCSPSPNTFVTCADVHQEQVPDPPVESRDEVDFMPSQGSLQNLDLPPYPSPLGSVVHSRQNSEEFPPPPSPLDLSALNDHLGTQSNTLLAQLQKKRLQILSQESDTPQLVAPIKSSGETWLKELQAKQAVLRSKRDQNNAVGVDVVNTQRYKPDEQKTESVKNLASKFENIDIKSLGSGSKVENNGLLSMKKREEYDPMLKKQLVEEICEVNTANIAVPMALTSKKQTLEDKKLLAKKKSVSFCDQVILVATADEQEDDSYIPNPILERVLRTAMNKPEASAIKQEILALRSNMTDENSNIAKLPERNVPVPRRNSFDNLLTPPSQSAVAITANNHPIYSQESQYGHQVTQNLNNGFENGLQCNGNFVNKPSNCHYIDQHYSGSKDIPTECHNAQRFNYPDSPYNVPTNYPCEEGPQVPCPGYCPATISPHCNPPRQYMQSPYQHVPQNSPAYCNYYAMNGNRISPTYQASPQFVPNVRQFNPSPMNFPSEYSSPPHGYPQKHYQAPTAVEPPHVYQRYDGHLEHQTRPQENTQHLYRRHVNDDNYGYQRLPPHALEHIQKQENSPYIRLAEVTDKANVHDDSFCYQKSPPLQNHVTSDDYRPYQRIPQREYDTRRNNTQQPTHSPYQQVPTPVHVLKKSVSFEQGTKGGCESPQPKAIVTPIIVNNANNSVPTDRTKCNLCLKKNVVALNLYCQDCEFYMSKFKPRT